MKFGHTIVLLLTLTLCFQANELALACTCAGLGGSERTKVMNEKTNSVVVFRGKVSKIEVNRPPGLKTVTLEVDRVWKGRPDRITEVVTEVAGSECGYEFVEGTRYLVYCFSYDNRLRTDICTRTRLWSKAGTDAAVLGKGHSV